MNRSTAASTAEASVNFGEALKSTPRRGLKQVDFRFDGMNLRGLEQNPDTKSRWAAMARAGKKVMQFLEQGRYLAVVVDGKVHLYKKSAAPGLNRRANV